MPSLVLLSGKLHKITGREGELGGGEKFESR